MSIKDEIESDLRQYLKKATNLSDQDRLANLMAIFGKHFAFYSSEYRLQNFDLQSIIMEARPIAGRQTLPIIVSEKEMEFGQAGHVAMVESVLSFLNKNELLKKVVKIDYSDYQFKIKG